MVTSEKIDNDELTAFVTSTLNAIAGGVEASDSNTRRFKVPDRVSFEIAVKAVRTAGAGASLKLQIFNADIKKSDQNEEMSRVSFDVTSDSTSSWGPRPEAKTSVV